MCLLGVQIVNWYQLLGLETSFYYDLPNFFICIVTVILLSIVTKMPRNYTIILLVHCFVPLLLNDVLFSAAYFGDQFRYVGAVREIRTSFSLSTEVGNVANASWLLAFIPLPFIETVSSLGYFNKFIFILLFAFLYSKRVLNKFSAYFLLLYPSIVLYTGLSLRDTLIFVCMMLTAHFAIKRNILLMVLCISPLFVIKFQNFFILLPLFAFAILNLGEKGMSLQKGLIVLALTFITLIISFPIVQPTLNNLRLAMYVEDGGLNIEEVTLISGIGDFISLGLTSGLYFLVKPFPWEVSKGFQLIQALENLVIMLIIIRLTIKAWKVDINKLIFWLVLFIASLSIYGLVVFNYGTAARYRFSFIAMYVVYVSYACNITKVFGKKTVH